MTSSPGREALLQATIAIVANEGLRALTYRAVAGRAGVSHGLVRHHFGTRDQLIAAALEFAIEDSLRESSMHDDIEDADDFASGLESIASRSTDVQAFQYELLLESRRRPELRPHVERYYETYRDATYERLRRLGVEDEELMQAIWFALDGIVLKQLTLGGGDDIDRVLTRIRRLVREASHLA